MSEGVPTVTRRAWLAALEQANRATPDKVPAGWHTAQQLADLWGKTQQHTKRAASALVAKGGAECRKFRVDIGKRVYAVAHYRLTSKA